ncbi:hypothetical protein NFI95_15005 [Acetobacteraceae bacterium KSS8]|uniref:Uncharacterized protein n=1 Tax=Endosaccharibacter trunci TaxID=2812733 RepID=A0ABT1WBW0_9PROT|nr:hypothetical protein [Acetobacteraceae bacterium KSS8]
MYAAMSTRKHVVDDLETMTLFNELGQVIATYDKALDQKMCRFLERMVADGEYTYEKRDVPLSRRNAA